MVTEHDYIRGFNHGYLLSKHLPKLVNSLTASVGNNTGDYFSGFISGKKEYEIELQSVQLNELKSLRDKRHGKERGK